MCAHSFGRNRQLPFLQQRKGKNECRMYFMINLHERMLPDPAGIEPTNSWSQVRCTSIWATKPSSQMLGVRWAFWPNRTCLVLIKLVLRLKDNVLKKSPSPTGSYIHLYIRAYTCILEPVSDGDIFFKTCLYPFFNGVLKYFDLSYRTFDRFWIPMIKRHCIKQLLF